LIFSHYILPFIYEINNHLWQIEIGVKMS